MSFLQGLFFVNSNGCIVTTRTDQLIVAAELICICTDGDRRMERCWESGKMRDLWHALLEGGSKG